MTSLEMNGPYDFTSETIDKVVTKKSAGNYALGYTDSEGFTVQYIGRSDTDVASELKNYLFTNYKKFKFRYAASPKAAFEKECKNYHDFGGKEELQNKNHPDIPNGMDWKCPYCKQFG